MNRRFLCAALALVAGGTQAGERVIGGSGWLEVHDRYQVCAQTARGAVCEPLNTPKIMGMRLLADGQTLRLLFPRSIPREARQTLAEHFGDRLRAAESMLQLRTGNKAAWGAVEPASDCTDMSPLGRQATPQICDDWDDDWSDPDDLIPVVWGGLPPGAPLPNSQGRFPGIPYDTKANCLAACEAMLEELTAMCQVYYHGEGRPACYSAVNTSYSYCMKSCKGLP